VFSRSAERREQFARELSAELSIDIQPVDSAAAAVRDMPLVTTATTSRTPVFAGSDVAAGATVCAMGSNWLDKAEIDLETVQRASKVVCDSIEACRHEAGDFVEAIQTGVFGWDTALELGDVVAGRTPGRVRPDEIILFKSVGLAIEDVALAAKAYELARETNVGTELPI
jgi:ornithine cyclodeaminase/alanine dehydrogenase-like protein (mu-crystallin family)